MSYRAIYNSQIWSRILNLNYRMFQSWTSPGAKFYPYLAFKVLTASKEVCNYDPGCNAGNGSSEAIESFETALTQPVCHDSRTPQQDCHSALSVGQKQLMKQTVTQNQESETENFTMGPSSSLRQVITGKLINKILMILHSKQDPHLQCLKSEDSRKSWHIFSPSAASCKMYWIISQNFSWLKLKNGAESKQRTDIRSRTCR